MTASEEYLLREMAFRHRTTHVRDRVVQSMMLRSARDKYEKIRIRRMILEARATWRIGETLHQRKWQTTVSRRPNRGRHHDSWAAREAYVRCHGDYFDYLPYAHAVRSKVA